jgi:diguanylate cyclase (GGDEF)-like protein
MAESDLSDDSPHGGSRTLGDLEAVLRGACRQLEDNIVTWIADVNLAQATMAGARCDGPTSDVAEHLARLEDALRGAPDRFEKQLRERMGAVPIEIAQRHEGLDDLPDRDSLTGLFNRRGFETELAKEVRAARDGFSGAVLLIDLDHFKRVNDRVGHIASDGLLKAVADALKHRIRRTDILARVGGDQFGVILPQTDGDHARIVADGIVKAFRRGTAFVNHPVVCPTASVGVVLFDSLSDKQVLSRGELALYQAKEAGGDRFALYGNGMDHRDRASARVDQLNRIHQALEEERLLLYCQPIVDLANNEVSQYELLLRLQIEEGAPPLSPCDFLGIAERFGLIQSIDCWVVRQAIALLADRVGAEPPLILHVNVSAKSIGDPEFAAITEAALAAAAIDPAHLVLELTETGAITNLENAKSFTSRLRKIGCQFALDDFGAGFGSFYNLKYLPFDLLKIDGDFVRNFAAGPVDQLVVNAIVTIARGMGKKTVAEFVESAEMSRLLRESGVDYGQGYYLGRPRPVGEVLFNSSSS